MQTKRLVIIVLFLGISLNLFAESKKMVKSQLKEATVFFRGAELTHTASTALQKGETEIQILGLSPVIDINSIKINTNNGVLVSAFEFTVDYLASDKNPKIDSTEVEKMQNVMIDYQRQIAEIDVSNKVNTQMLSVLQKSIIKNVEGSEQGLGIDDLVKTLDYYKTKSLELENQLREDRIKREKINKEIVKLQSQLRERTKINDKASGILKLNLASLAATNTTITISYYTAAAGWVPYHDINVASTSKPIKITTKAKVRQTTGLDWEKVKLSLSTSAPGSGKVAPLFSSWFLQYLQPMEVVSVGYGKAKKTATQNSYSYEIAENQDGDFLEEIVVLQPAAKPAPTMNDYVVQSENQLNITYSIDIPYSIPGTGKELNIELRNQEVEASFKYYSAPKLDLETYVLAEIGDWQKLNLLSGKANVTYDGTYVGETFINAASTHENLTLTLGSDKRVPVKREKQQDYSSTKILSSDIKQTFNYKLTVRNNQNVPIKMVLKDQYPKSTLKEIEVEFLSKDTTKPSFNIEDIGVVTWEFDMQAGETRTFNFAYSIKYPKGEEINL